MNLIKKNLLITWVILISLSVIYLSNDINEIKQEVKDIKTDIQSIKTLIIDSLPVSIQMQKNIDKYCEQYEVPQYIAYNIAYRESTYRGPNDIKYKHDLVSPSGAKGPMQIMPSTAKFINNGTVDKNKLINNIEYNVSTGIKLLSYLYKKYGDWQKVAGCYNTGKPIVNNYAIYVATNTDYKNKWISVAP